MSGMMEPSQIDTCTPALIQESFRVARERGITMQIHAAQSVVEFNEMTRRHGMTPVEWLDDLGVLADGTIISHGRSEEHTSELQSLMRTSYAFFCLKNKK